MFQNGIDNVRHEGKYALTYSLYSPKVFQDNGPLYSPFQRPTPHVDGNAIIQNTWEELSKISASRNYTGLSLGDKKEIVLNGTMGTVTFDNYSCYAYIIGFDHNSELEGQGISFCIAIDTNKKEISFISQIYNTTSNGGTKCFNLQHWGSSSIGGWSGCDARYDILGSTDIQPSGYGSSVGSGREGYDATSTCSTNPVQNTLMSCLPLELRNVMIPITKYSNNVGTSAIESSITSSIDYLPLLSVFEATGTTDVLTTYVNTFEGKYQKQYDYFKENLPIKYRSDQDTVASIWWTRSPMATVSNTFSVIVSTGASSYNTAAYSYGIAPIFLI